MGIIFSQAPDENAGSSSQTAGDIQPTISSQRACSDSPDGSKILISQTLDENAGSSSQAAGDSSQRACSDGSKLTWMNPKNIKFSQECVSPLFRKSIIDMNKSNGELHTSFAQALKTGGFGRNDLSVLLEELKRGQVKVEDIPPIRIIKHDNHWYSLDNRRLWVFREFGKDIPVQLVHDVEARKEFHKKFVPTACDGESISIRSGADRAVASESPPSLLAEVLRWSIGDIQNDKLLVNQVNKLPLDFTSLQHYLNSFMFLLYEEVRASLQQSLERINDAPVFGLKTLEERRLSSRGPLKEFEIVVSTKSSFKSKDVVMLTTTEDIKTWSLNKLQCYTLALLGESKVYGGKAVGDNEEEEESSGVIFKATIYAPNASPEYKSLHGGDVAWFAVSLNSLATAMRIWNALHEPTAAADYPIFNEILRAQPILSGVAEESHEVYQLGAAQLSSFNLNHSQMKALSETVVSLATKRKPLVRLIQGLPGTGKTSMLVAMLTVLSTSRQRILMSAPTNAAITEVLTRFLNAIRRAPAPADTSSPVRVVSSGDVVLVGNEEGLAVDENEFTSAVFVRRRIQRLYTALNSLTGWRRNVMVMIEFLSSAWELYEEYVRVAQSVNSNEQPPPPPPETLLTFVEFVRKKMKLLGEQMMSNLETVCSDLPSVFITSTEILGAEKHLKAVNSALSRSSVVSDSTVRSWFDMSRINVARSKEPVCVHLNALRELLADNLGFVTYPVGKVPDTRELLKHAAVVCCTVSSAGKDVVQRALPPFDVAIIDEASQVVEAETAIVIGLPSLKQLVLVGDHQQLPATVLSKTAQDCGYGRSLFLRLKQLEHPSIMLNVQYRMHPSISRFPSSQFYQGLLKDAPNVEAPSYGKVTQSRLYGPYAFLNVVGHEVSDEKHSKTSPVEVAVLMHLLRKLNVPGAGRILEVGIISPYASQVEAIRERLDGRYFEFVEVDTRSVDGFQGREKDVILLSTVRSNTGGKIGFMEDHRRLNVAVTRARHVLCVVGNAQTLMDSGGVWKELVYDAKARSCFYDCSQYPQMRKVIRRAELELEQHEKLWNPKSDLFSKTI